MVVLALNSSELILSFSERMHAHVDASQALFFWNIHGKFGASTASLLKAISDTDL